MCLSVFAVASRWSNDIRVLPESALEKKPHEMDWSLAGQTFLDAAISLYISSHDLLTCTDMLRQTFTGSDEV